MSATGLLRYHLMVNGLGRAALRLQRWQSERQAVSSRWKTDYLAPPLKIAPRTKELVARHWLQGRYANLNRKVAWVTSGAPAELLKARLNRTAAHRVRRSSQQAFGHAMERFIACTSRINPSPAASEVIRDDLTAHLCNRLEQAHRLRDDAGEDNRNGDAPPNRQKCERYEGQQRTGKG